MISNTEKRLSNIEKSLKELKAAYLTSGANVKLYNTSDEITVTVTNTTMVRIKFTPKYKASGTVMTNLSGKITRISGSSTFTFWGAHQETQVDGDSIICFPFLNNVGGTITATFKLTIIASGTSPGTFTRIV